MQPYAHVNADDLYPQQAWILDQFNGVTYQPNEMDVQDEPLYDTITSAAAATIADGTRFFANQAGKTLNQTNVERNNELPAPEAFTVQGIGWWFSADALLADVVTMMTSFCLEFWIGSKSYNRAPLWHYVAGGGIHGFSNLTTESALTNGVPGMEGAHYLKINLVVDNQSSFYGQLRGSAVTLAAAGSGGTGLIQVMRLLGLHARGVQ